MDLSHPRSRLPVTDAKGGRWRCWHEGPTDWANGTWSRDRAATAVSGLTVQAPVEFDGTRKDFSTNAAKTTRHPCGKNETGPRVRPFPRPPLRQPFPLTLHYLCVAQHRHLLLEASSAFSPWGDQMFVIHQRVKKALMAPRPQSSPGLSRANRDRWRLPQPLHSSHALHAAVDPCACAAPSPDAGLLGDRATAVRPHLALPSRAPHGVVTDVCRPAWGSGLCSLQRAAGPSPT